MRGEKFNGKEYMEHIKSNIAFIVASIFYTVVTLVSLKFPFFWDNILFSSKTAFYFYNEALSNLILSPGLDSGHPPFWGKMISIVWLLFGKSIIVSHIIMWPLLIAMAYNFIQFSKQVLPALLVLPATILMLLEPTLLAHSTMVSLEIVLVCGFFGAMNAIFKNKFWSLSLWCLLISLTSIRGIFLTIAIFICYCVYQYYFSKRVNLFKAVKPFLLSGMAVFIWYMYHWYAAGYFFQSPDSGWAANNTVTNASVLFKNLVFTFWRFIDYGRWIILISFIPILLFLARTKNFELSQKLRFVLYTLLIVSIVLITAVSITKSPPLHRYYIISYLLISILFLYLLHQFNNNQIKKLVFGLVCISLVTGHLWVYPEKLAQGWDGSLAHIPFFKLKSKMLNYIDNENINRKNVLTDFPLINANYYSDLGTKRNDFIPKHKAKFNEKDYILQSNICNGFNDEELIELKTNWQLKKEFKKNRIYIRLYENPLLKN